MKLVPIPGAPAIGTPIGPSGNFFNNKKMKKVLIQCNRQDNVIPGHGSP